MRLLISELHEEAESQLDEVLAFEHIEGIVQEVESRSAAFVALDPDVVTTNASDGN